MVTPDQRTRAGRVIRQPEGYSAFVPKPLPPEPPLGFDSQLATILAAAGTAVGRLDGVAATLPNPELFRPQCTCAKRQSCPLRSRERRARSTMSWPSRSTPIGSKLPRDIEEVVTTSVP